MSGRLMTSVTINGVEYMIGKIDVMAQIELFENYGGFILSSVTQAALNGLEPEDDLSPATISRFIMSAGKNGITEALPLLDKCFVKDDDTPLDIKHFSGDVDALVKLLGHALKFNLGTFFFDTVSPAILEAKEAHRRLKDKS